MSASRKGLKRVGLRSYRIPAGHGPAIIIHKDNRYRWLIRPETLHVAFFFEEHRLLRDARKAAEAIAQGTKGFAPGLDLHQ